ncbi:activator of photopigment and puc with BLUF domain protein [Sphingomonas sp. Leaf231]|uniref:BLUF domain-containing protein n=1 Tax=Sphingomonas sp. Leaf231 TaxID=1736301 RepID=UPI0006FB54C2|nr:BLUF domain-containing protein [Sphingomonas sp. Leaf231]KQN94081.1 activator of photopigment and puc with BLUF domain protein [Sphingomonas sp. Leaf231]
MLQVVYISSAVGMADTAPILAASRRNNARDGLTGLLYADGRRFLQALEGEATAVEQAMKRIEADPRHRAVVMLSSRDVAVREFGEWSMAERVAGDDGDAFVRHVRSLIAGAAPGVRATFDGFVQLRRAA